MIDTKTIENFLSDDEIAEILAITPSWIGRGIKEKRAIVMWTILPKN